MTRSVPLVAATWVRNATVILAAAATLALVPSGIAAAAGVGTASATPSSAIAGLAGFNRADAATTARSAAAASVNKRGAASWALANWNGAYRFGDDCTNFVSSALAYGGGDPESIKPGGGSTSDDHYWYYLTAKYIRWWSHSWSVAHDLAVHLNLRGSYWLKYWSNAQPGDVIFANWSGSNFSGISHVGIITKMVNGEPYITQHSPSQKNISLNYWLNWRTNGGHHNVHVWIASPNAG